MIRIFTKLLIITLLVGSFTIGWLMGFDKGAASAFLIDGPPRSVVALGNLKNLNEGKTPSVRQMLEHEFDNGILNYGAFKKAWFRPLVEFTSMKEAVAYSESVMPLLAEQRSSMKIRGATEELNQEINTVLSPYEDIKP